MEPVLPPDLGRTITDHERRIKDVENRRYRTVDRLGDLGDVVVDQSGGPWAPDDGDTLVFDVELGNDRFPEGRWRPGEGGGGGGGGEFGSLLLGMTDAMTPWVIHLDSSPGIVLSVWNSGGIRGIVVEQSGVYHAAVSVWCDSGNAKVRLIGPPVSGFGGPCLDQRAIDEGPLSASASGDFALPVGTGVQVIVDAPGASEWGLRMSMHLVHLSDVTPGNCGG